VLEGLGAAVLVFLYLTVQGTAVDSMPSSPSTRPDSFARTGIPAILPATTAAGHYARNWREYRQQTLSSYRQSGRAGTATRAGEISN
jgi:hypothetical protein